MSKYAKTLTRWEVNNEGDLIHVGSGDPAWRIVATAAHYFPIDADAVARLNCRGGMFIRVERWQWRHAAI